MSQWMCHEIVCWVVTARASLTEMETEAATTASTAAQRPLEFNPMWVCKYPCFFFVRSFFSNWIIECVLQNSINKSKRKVTVKMAIKPSSSPHYLAHSVMVLLQFYLHTLFFSAISESRWRARERFCACMIAIYNFKTIIFLRIEIN